ncbi:nucleotidyltransferase family protein [Reichenbachiella sp. MALMAid0571]|uniref:nucleotidyltransferase family protein n=1 Tax=Reichenbachiella sp. MALMAid0571 TaxID=3143939 RepID=UPI0032DFBE38
MRSLFEIKNTLEINKEHLYKSYAIKSMAIFGSYSRNEQSEKSDLDLLVEFDEKIGVRFIDLAEELENYLKMKVDLVSKKGIKDKYYQVIKSDLIYV